MKKVVSVAAPFLMGSFSLGVPAQAPPPLPPQKAVVIAATPATASPCPQLEIQSPAGRTLRDGQPVTFGANISGGDPNVTPIIVWNISAGSIRDGQGTRRIEVDSTGAGANREIVADLWLGGYAPECSIQATATVKVVGPAKMVDEFGELPIEAEAERLNAFAAGAASTGDSVFVIVYAGRNRVRGYASAALQRIRRHFSAPEMQMPRISTIDGGFREQPGFELWLVPVGAEAPKLTPTVDRKEIVYPRTIPVRKP